MQISHLAATRRTAHDHPWLAAFIFALDRRLRQRHRVFEFTSNPACVFRLQLGCSDQDLVLSDGTCVRRGDPILKLHFWNEHIPSLPSTGASISWAREMTNAMKDSLRELAWHLAIRRDLDEVSIIHGDVSWATARQTQQLVRLCRHLGFEVIAGCSPVPMKERMHRFGENILVSLLVLAQNSAALRRDTLWRDRTSIFLSRRILERRYGARVDGLAQREPQPL